MVAVVFETAHALVRDFGTLFSLVQSVCVLLKSGDRMMFLLVRMLETSNARSACACAVWKVDPIGYNV